ncbi:MAG: elongation factor P maturation arginine rhamnosyltransferase EarP [Nitrosospira sp.]|nr:elongation factor P maturation arginine rhamnosyltransferase EarP [Nitrosospira sp.]MDW7643073.1 elongation factor P maturation arginine rhamnosyltransferase EarP [Nitrosomonadaceae bacterium]MBI0407375.1 elongation factor P maturation arginine rhamnosyltransferase EarP [Nitrosospira sp.]MBI0414381.1 elongation factor P maturation arginine rhamnosyltransferase EarP [Nitrosospira sp.]MBI0416976.1 elongation factor P maturation arginine rhamnosyltransferase EarP [Nitrosospira sp.]
MNKRWDIFCTVIDNFGDIGVCWRLARQLASQHELVVRLWINDLVSFNHIAPDVDLTAKQQWVQSVDIRYWQESFINIEPADVVIEAFSCKLPDSYINSMITLPQTSVWLNLEYLSAENWVIGCHGLASPHPYLPLIKHFFFPGFVSGTGGLLLEQHLLIDKKSFNALSQLEFWRHLGVPERKEKELRVSMFCYDDAPLGNLLSVLATSSTPVYVLLFQGPIVNSAAVFFGVTSLEIGGVLQSGQLTVQLIPFLEQSNYDRLLWACDINFVRGEDSFVRAQWATRPFIWHIYPQENNAHQIKLDAFLDLYTRDMPSNMAATVLALWHSWNDGTQIKDAWLSFIAQQVNLTQHSETWVDQLSSLGDLASNLILFSQENRI